MPVPIDGTPRPSRKIKIVCDGSHKVVAGSRVVDAETGEDLSWVRRVEVILDARDYPRAILYIDNPEIEITAEAEIRENERPQEQRIADNVVARLKNFIIHHIDNRISD